MLSVFLFHTLFARVGNPVELDAKIKVSKSLKRLE